MKYVHVNAPEIDAHHAPRPSLGRCSICGRAVVKVDAEGASR